MKQKCISTAQEGKHIIYRHIYFDNIFPPPPKKIPFLDFFWHLYYMKNITIIITGFIFCLIFAGCRLQTDMQEDNIVFILPEWPPEENACYPELYAWKIMITSANGKKEMLIPKNSGTKCISIRQYKNVPLCITACPVTITKNGITDFFRPAGALYPYECNSENTELYTEKNSTLFPELTTKYTAIINLTWTSGYTAYVMQQLFNCSSDFSEKSVQKNFTASFNWKKFNAYILSRTEKISEDDAFNPWIYDIDKILSAISKKKFSVQLFSSSNIRIVKQAEISEILSKTEPDFCNPSEILSSYIPENITKGMKNPSEKQVNSFSVSASKDTFFMMHGRLLIINAGFPKKISVRTVPMPILLDGL